MTISRTAVVHCLSLGATALATVGAAVAAPSTGSEIAAGTAGLTLLSGLLVAVNLARLAHWANLAAEAVPTLVRLEPILWPLVRAEINHIRAQQPAKATRLGVVKPAAPALIVANPAIIPEAPVTGPLTSAQAAEVSRVWAARAEAAKHG